jgi:UDP-2,3-diacylglucosamine hydrolase
VHRLFISDLHLSDQTPSIETGLNDLMTRERGVESLVILGDFFEAWVGDDDDAPLAVRVKELLRRVSLAGCEILSLQRKPRFHARPTICQPISVARS